MKKLLLLAIVVLGISAVSFGQDGNTLTASSTASAKILNVLTIQLNSGSLNFGAMTVPQAAATVELTYGKSRSIKVGTGKISLLEIDPQIDVPEYKVTGDPDANFSITLPTADVVLGTGVKVNNFSSSVGIHPALDGTGERIFTVGADLVLTTAAVANEYSQSFDVTVAYE